MKISGLAILAGTAIALAAGSVLAAPNGQAQASKLVATKFGTTTLSGEVGAVGPDIRGPLATEIQKPKKLGKSPLRRDPAAGDAVPLAPGVGAPTSSGKKAKSNPEMNSQLRGCQSPRQPAGLTAAISSRVSRPIRVSVSGTGTSSSR